MKSTVGLAVAGEARNDLIELLGGGQQIEPADIRHDSLADGTVIPIGFDDLEIFVSVAFR